MEAWPHQKLGVSEVLSAIWSGQRKILLTSPTGGGKTKIMCDLIDLWANADLKVCLYTNRKMLVEQTARVMAGAGIDFGVRAAGWEGDQFEKVQVCSIQTENSRVYRKQDWQLHAAQRVIVDEAHMQTGAVARKILEEHTEAGAAVVGFTATPIGLGDIYDHLIVAGTNSELRKCGALVPCLHYGPTEPDLKHIGRVNVGEDLSESQNRKAIMVPGIFGHVLEWWKKLNPKGKPTILFAPGVAESIWFAEQFLENGITAAHIDGEECWINGTTYQSDARVRADILAGSEDGSIAVVCNRFVLREGIDCPWLAHGIFATVFGSLQSYLQSGGRLLRSHPTLQSVTLQDHGGNWHRHGSLNADRAWSLHASAGMISGLREDRLRNGQEPQPARCPMCGLIIFGTRCRACGWELPKGGRRSRPVIQADGTLKEYKGEVYKPRPICQRADGPELWKRMYFRARSPKWSATFRQAFAMFARENNFQWPDRSWPYMPINPADEYLKVVDVPRERLR